MSTRTETRWYVTCDGCGEEYPTPSYDGSIGVRVLAGIDGWKFQQGAPGRNGKGYRKQGDLCGKCVEAGASL